MVTTARTQLEAALTEVAKERTKGFAEVARERAELHRESEAMQTHKEEQEGRVELNIGGQRFETSVQTLRRVPHTFFDAYNSGRYAQDVCTDGSIFVDRDGEHFSHILEYMRDDVISVAAQEALKLDVSLLRALKREFEFYCIELVAVPEEPRWSLSWAAKVMMRIPYLYWNATTMNVSGMWLEGAPMMTARSCFGLCEVGGMLYASGGFDAEHDQLASVECYDPILDTWSAAPALPRGRFGHYACAVTNTMYMYVHGGCEGRSWTRSILKFDSGAQAWSEVATMPQAYHNYRACVIGKNIFLFGGCGSSEDESLIAIIFCYNTANDVWSTLAPKPMSLIRNHSVCEISGLIYVIGGKSSSEIADTSVNRFDPATNTWSTVASLSGPRVGLASFVLIRGGIIYAAGGLNETSIFLSSVER
jgi:hypothetical protein